MASAIPPAQHKYEIDKFEKPMVLNHTNEMEVATLMARLSHDGTSSKILNSCSPIIEEYLVGSLNDCIIKHIFPDCLKIAKVIPLFKQADESLPSSYRPMRLLGSFSKVLRNFFTNEW